MHGHRHGGHQGAVRQLAALEQEPPQYPGAQCHHHVVDGHPEPGLDPLDVGHIDLGDGDVARPGDGAVEGGGRGRKRRGHRPALARAKHGLRQRQHRRRHHGRQPQRPHREALQSADRDLERIATTRATGGLRCGGLGIQSAQLGQQVRAGHAVHDGVVDLEHQGHRVGACAALEYPHLPQRPVAVQR
jgi:hypothetical protein